MNHLFSSVGVMLHLSTNFSSVLIGYRIENFWRLENLSIP